MPFVIDCEGDKQVPAIEYRQNFAGTKQCGMEIILGFLGHTISLFFFSFLNYAEQCPVWM